MSRWQALNAKYHALSMRERLLIFVSGLVLVLFGGYSLFVDPLYLDLKKTQSAIYKTASEQSQLQAQIADLQARLRKDLNKLLEQEIAEAEKAIAEVDKQLQSQTTDLVPAYRMAEVLEEVLSKAKGVRVLALNSKAPQPMLDLVDESGQQINLYQHGIVLKVEGRYFDLMRFIGAVEGLDTRFYWKRFDYGVESYPKAELELELFTLSTSRTFMGS
ncbi:type II secretion system protein GspM [Corallincola platygyrae]|uniref:Type II secretion system protein GspM n=1 Tax=Corallincola platygyrae TaxID=1193278 RepID=A0ABW4XRC0_9GAMM